VARSKGINTTPIEIIGQHHVTKPADGIWCWQSSNVSDDTTEQFELQGNRQIAPNPCKTEILCKSPL
jgi:hypothetical protein